MNDITNSQWYAINLLNEYFNIKFTGQTKQDAMYFIKKNEKKYKEAKIEKERDRYEEDSFYRDGYESNGWW